ncbi:alginate export family protein [Aquimarina sp. U1-2]|uniref:alginate export family protein n=1 Tax=Aquimarina sp. U1-2 TaxID=2823141 RepID=UPI001AECDC63|nr:alginate export family protein [Aquimarina sp. U1-2]MBP2833760.1 alginate export family protein [Aquimarina sp. U1-2]
MKNKINFQRTLGLLFLPIIWMNASLFAQEMKAQDSTGLEQFDVNDIHGQLFISRRFNIIRYLDRFDYLRTNEKINFWERLKFIPIHKKTNTYLSIGGDVRTRFDYFKTDNFDALPTPTEEYRYDQRLMLHVAIRHKYFGVFSQVLTAWRAGNDLPDSPVDADDLALHQLFFILKYPHESTGKQSYLRIGRQEAFIGSGRLFAIREDPNVRRSYDGARSNIFINRFKADLFYFREVPIEPNALDNDWLSDRELFGIYTTTPLHNQENRLNLELYHAGINHWENFNQDVIDEDERQTVGARLVHRHNHDRGFDFDLEANYQFGSAGGIDINAYSVSTDIEYFWNINQKEHRLGLEANIFSGDRQANDGESNTYNPLNPALGFLSRTPFFNFSNLITVNPSYRLLLPKGIAVTSETAFAWRQNTSDVIYSPPGLPYFGNTYNNENSYVGFIPSIELEWAPSAFLSFELFYSGLFKGNYFSGDSQNQHNMAFITYLRF